MSDFLISDLVNYAQCASKLQYPANPKLYDTREAIGAYLVSNLFNLLFNEILSEKIPDNIWMNKQLNILWNKIKKKISFNVSANDYVIFQSFTKRLLNHLSTYNKIEVIASNQIFDYNFNEDVIKVPLTLFRSSQDIYCYYIDPDVFSDDEPVGYIFLYDIVPKLAKQITKNFYYKVNPLIYRSQTLRSYNCKTYSDVDKALSNLLLSIKSNIFFPRISANCKFCKSKEDCTFFNESTN